MKQILKKAKRRAEHGIFNLFRLFPIKENRILFESEADLTDNSFAFYDYLSKESKYISYTLIWLVEPSYKGNKTFIYKWTRGINVKRLYYLATSKYFFFDHNNVLSEYPRRNGQRIINLFHGCTFKGSKGGVDNTNTEEMMPVTGDFWKQIMADFVSCSVDKVQSLGYPRNDYFFKEVNSIQEKWKKEHSWDSYKKVILWMPTFRKSCNETLSENYYSGITGLPILEQKEELGELNEELKKLGNLVVFKVHHLQADYPAFKEKYSNIQILKDKDINEFGLQLYQIVPLTDILITDYSSISNDYLLMDKPMIFTLDDYETYRSSRGFSVDDPAQYFIGYHVYTKNELIGAIRELSDGYDYYKEERKKILPIMHKYQDGNSCKRIADYVGL